MKGTNEIQLLFHLLLRPSLLILLAPLILIRSIPMQWNTVFDVVWRRGSILSSTKADSVAHDERTTAGSFVRQSS